MGRALIGLGAVVAAYQVDLRTGRFWAYEAAELINPGTIFAALMRMNAYGRLY